MPDAAEGLLRIKENNGHFNFVVFIGEMSLYDRLMGNGVIVPERKHFMTNHESDNGDKDR